MTAIRKRTPDPKNRKLLTKPERIRSSRKRPVKGEFATRVLTEKRTLPVPGSPELLKTERLLAAEKRRRKEAERKFGESHEKLLKIVDSIRDGFFTIDRKWRFTFVNNEALGLWGKRPDQLLGKSIWRVIPEALGTVFEEQYRAAMSGHVPVIFDAVSPILGIWVEVRAYPTDEGLSVYFHDITRRKNTEEELNRYRNRLEELVAERTSELGNANEKLQQQVIEHTLAEMRKTEILRNLESANRELNDFAYVVSHDLKAPLRAISSLVDWISDDYADKFDEAGKLQLKLMVNRVQRMHKFIDGILEYSKIGRNTEKAGLVDLNELVEEVVETLSLPPNIRVIMENRLPSIVCERTRLVQVFQNLVDNAIKSIYGPKGEIRIGYNMEENFHLFSVSDNGTGIDRKYFGKIFQIFQTLRARDEVESTGIGLALVKKIIEVYGGKIWVDSRIGEGSIFYFTLPKELNG